MLTAMRRIIYVEDVYGEGFHRKLLAKLKEKGLLDSNFNPRVESLPAGKCNAALRRKVLAKVVEGMDGALKALFVIDSEGDPSAADVAIRGHFKDVTLKFRPKVYIDVVAVEPLHEAWLCIGLGGDRRACRRDPETVLSRLRNMHYEKRCLERWADHVNIDNLMHEPDFKIYVERLKWLAEDP